MAQRPCRRRGPARVVVLAAVSLVGIPVAGAPARATPAAAPVRAAPVVGSAAVAPAPAPGETAGVSADPFGNLSIFIRDATTGHLIWTGRFQDQPRWAPLDLGGIVTTGAAGLTNQTTDSYAWVFARGANGAVYHRLRFAGGSGFLPWTSDGGAILGTPSASCLGDQTTPPILWVRALDGSLYRRVLSGGWHRVGGALAADPGAVPPTQGACPPYDDVFVLGTDQAIREWDGERFRLVGGRSTVAPAAVRLADGGTWLFARGTDGALWLSVRVVDGGRWSAAWRRLGGSLDAAPAATVFQDRASVVVRFTDGSLREGHFDAGSWVWSTVLPAS